MKFGRLMLLTLTLIGATPLFVAAETAPVTKLEIKTDKADPEPDMQYRVEVIEEHGSQVPLTSDMVTKPYKQIELPPALGAMVRCALTYDSDMPGIVCMPKRAGVQVHSIASNALGISDVDENRVYVLMARKAKPVQPGKPTTRGKS